MPDDGQTEAIGIAEKAARKLAASHGTGSYLKCIPDSMNTANVKSRNENLGIARKGNLGISSAANKQQHKCKRIAPMDVSRWRGVIASLLS